ncbi:Na(+)/H(+) antiporter subunit F1 [Texcoconibacillus texcoconensis]|uniref:Multicomponent Na+:H+ antiporter subunit F n=1 Tax=Texcoconibacillus texcoconensis TaxID=1095777 RepID=A0A840QR98_9BACI|nr:Na(+)/H(+) antiporter subunit F1 [Texcoconibacillus texcoconensis]MBB5173982.1 multicomponent Na+:H+ antiporter subunit F [Texcoconibacillus texcoconensis]
MLDTVFLITLFVMAVAMLALFYRAIKGPTMSDRIVALDTLGISLIGFIGIVMMIQDTLAYSDVMLVLAILAFIGSIALAKFVEGGVVLDRTRD